MFKSFLMSVAAICCLSLSVFAAGDISLDTMKISVSAEENRPVSFTNKQAAFYYTQSHKNDHPEHAWFRGLNIAKKRIFSGYEVLAGGKKLNRMQADVAVYPHKLVRTHKGGMVETMELFDHKDIVKISVAGAGGKVGLSLLGDQVTFDSIDSGVIFFKTSEDASKVIAVAGQIGPASYSDGNSYTDEAGFYIIVANSKDEAFQQLKDVRQEGALWLDERAARMQTQLEQNSYLDASDNRFDKAMRWMVTTMDQLVTKQRGDGIYAGVPWFNEYWGRDSFIALPGANLVTGQFATARDIITSFAKFQDMNPASRFYGRVPNIVKPDEIDYHTTDGTPRFIAEMLDYVKYSGDKSLIADMYPNVTASIDGSLKNWTDDKGYLLHKDNETWMDARRASDKKEYSPRGTRANDIQALWYKQLLAGVYFAEYMNDDAAAERWAAVAEQVRDNFERDFKVSGQPYLADRLKADGSADYQLRPNQLFAFDMVQDEAFLAVAMKTVWQELVYPWGVASLDQADPFFHPYHLNQGHYHKDQAYHNGTVWLWNNGIAMQRMIELGQADLAYELFKNMNEFALTRGVVGGLAENSDAYPRGSAMWPKLTGTYLQAWSNSEHLRVWYQYFLGVRPDMVEGVITLAPRMPSEINTLEYSVKVGDGMLHGTYNRKGDAETFTYRLEGLSVFAKVKIEGFKDQTVDMETGSTITVMKENFVLLLKSADMSYRVKASPELMEQRRILDQMLKGIKFAEPREVQAFPVME